MPAQIVLKDTIKIAQHTVLNVVKNY